MNLACQNSKLDASDAPLARTLRRGGFVSATSEGSNQKSRGAFIHGPTPRSYELSGWPECDAYTEVEKRLGLLHTVKAILL